MKKQTIYFFSFVFCFLFLVTGTLTSCKSGSVPLSNSETKTIITEKTVLHDTIFETQKDSSYYQAWLDCQEGKVVIKSKITSRKGRILKPPRVLIKDNHITVDCEAEAQKLFAQWKETYKTNNQFTATTHTVEVERQLTWWQKFQIWCGRLFLVCALFFSIKLILKFYKPF